MPFLLQLTRVGTGFPKVMLPLNLITQVESLCSNSPYAPLLPLTPPVPTASSTASRARVMRGSFFKPGMRVQCHQWGGGPTGFSPRSMRTSLSQCTPTSASWVGIPRGHCWAPGHPKPWWESGWGRVPLRELTPRLSWGRSRIPMEGSVRRDHPSWDRLDLYRWDFAPSSKGIQFVYWGVHPKARTPDQQALSQETQGNTLTELWKWSWSSAPRGQSYWKGKSLTGKTSSLGLLLFWVSYLVNSFIYNRRTMTPRICSQLSRPQVSTIQESHFWVFLLFKKHCL